MTGTGGGGVSQKENLLPRKWAKTLLLHECREWRSHWCLQKGAVLDMGDALQKICWIACPSLFRTRLTLQLHANVQILDPTRRQKEGTWRQAQLPSLDDCSNIVTMQNCWRALSTLQKTFALLAGGSWQIHQPLVQSQLWDAKVGSSWWTCHRLVCPQRCVSGRGTYLWLQLWTLWRQGTLLSAFESLGKADRHCALLGFPMLLKQAELLKTGMCRLWSATARAAVVEATLEGRQTSRTAICMFPVPHYSSERPTAFSH